MKFCCLFLIILLPSTLACGDVILGSGTFETPNHPFDYYDYADCVWYVKSNTSRGISLYFESFETEPTYDYVTVTLWHIVLDANLNFKNVQLIRCGKDGTVRVKCWHGR
jgi:CUB domain